MSKLTAYIIYGIISLDLGLESTALRRSLRGVASSFAQNFYVFAKVFLLSVEYHFQK